ncbi:hypothetical protein BD311DRAFT_748461 [Dichomitus squalens]|uniref:Uncharacterized protein n=1 Tax=Dichomitus squalens TaxID=114155 RepID=A0A4Q9N322_9APHY|nr:hypothetical protein BD311DRAFT_748461 [Dichomitus squalens]
MISNSFPCDRERSPTPLSQWQTKAETAAGKGKKPIYPNRSWVRVRDSDPPSVCSRDGAEKPALLARMSDTGKTDKRYDHGQRESAVKEGGEEGEVSQVLGEKMQDEPSVQTVTSGVRIKTEELPVTIPSPTRSEHLVRRKRGSRSTIDVFGNPTDFPPSGMHDSIMNVPKEENESVESTKDGVIDVDAFLAAALPPQTDKLYLVNSSSSMSPTTTYNTVGRPPADVIAHVGGMSASVSRSTSSPAVPPLRQSPPLSQRVLDQCRAILVPLVERNAKLRKPGVDEETVKRRAYRLLSDKLCADFVKLAKQVREQISGEKATDTMHSVKRVREPGPDISVSPPKRPKLELPTEPSLEIVTPMALDEDTPMDQDTEVLPPADHAEVHVPADVTPPPSSRSRIASPSNPDPALNRDRYPDISPTDLQPHPAIPLPFPAASSSSLGSPSPTIPTSQPPAPDEPSMQVPSEMPSDNQCTIIIPATSSPFLPPHSPQTSSVSIDREDIAATQEADNIASDSSRQDSETVTRILDRTPEDERVVQEPDDDMHSVQRPNDPPSEDYPPCVVPGLWGNVRGQPSARIESMDFFVDHATADAIQRWSTRQKSISLNERHVAVHLLCLPITPAQAVLQDPRLSPEDVAATLFDIPSDWPEPGKLVVEVKREDNTSGTAWFTHQPSPWTTHLDITLTVQHGKNTLDLIHLAPLADRLFVLHAAEPSEDEKMAAYKQTLIWLNLERARRRPKSPRSPKGVPRKPSTSPGAASSRARMSPAASVAAT